MKNYAIISAALAVITIPSWFGLVSARERGDFEVLLGWAYLTLGLAVGSALCLAVPLVRMMEARTKNRRGCDAGRPSLVDPYTARYSNQDRAIAIILALLAGALAFFMVFHSLHRWAQLFAIVMFCVLLVNVVNVTVTSICFTNDRIIARLPWSRAISEPYTAVERIQPKAGSLRIEFSNGRSLHVHPGLGDPDIVISYLQEQCRAPVDAGE